MSRSICFEWAECADSACFFISCNSQTEKSIRLYSKHDHQGDTLQAEAEHKTEFMLLIATKKKDYLY